MRWRRRCPPARRAGSGAGAGPLRATLVRILPRAVSVPHSSRHDHGTQPRSDRNRCQGNLRPSRVQAPLPPKVPELSHPCRRPIPSLPKRPASTRAGTSNDRCGRMPRHWATATPPRPSRPTCAPGRLHCALPAASTACRLPADGPARRGRRGSMPMCRTRRPRSATPALARRHRRRRGAAGGPHRSHSSSRASPRGRSLLRVRMSRYRRPLPAPSAPRQPWRHRRAAPVCRRQWPLPCRRRRRSPPSAPNARPRCRN